VSVLKYVPCIEVAAFSRASSAEEVFETGQYFYNYRPIAPSSAAHDDRSALLLWQHSMASAEVRTLEDGRLTHGPVIERSHCLLSGEVKDRSL
jgi:hypothetical protein